MSVLVAACAVAALAGSTGGAVVRAAGQPVSGFQRISHDVVLTNNWAGYSVHRDGTVFSDVQGSWTQPTATCSGKKTTYAAFFVGIDGAISTSPSVEQIGTEANCVRGSTVYDAWYEMYPDPAMPIPDCVIEPGQVISGQVHANGGTSFTVSLAIDGNEPCFSQTVTAPGTPTRTTAEWIAEAPAFAGRIFPLTDFDHVDFSAAATTGTDGQTETGNILDSAWDHDTINMLAHGNPLHPSYKALPDGNTLTGSAFTVDWVSS